MKELIDELRLAADVKCDDFPELILRAVDVIELQAREIERLRGYESDWERMLNDQAREIAALKAQPGGVVMPDREWLQEGGLVYSLEDGVNHYEINVTQAAGSRKTVERENLASKIFQILNGDCLNQPASAGDEREAWTERKPTEEGAYWIRGNGLEADALVQVKQEEGELWCNLHMRNSEAVFDTGYKIEQLSSDFEWLGPLQARANLSANHVEQVRAPEGWQLVPVEANEEMIATSIDLGRIDPDEVSGIWEAMLAAAPSAGSQKEQGE